MGGMELAKKIEELWQTYPLGTMRRGYHVKPSEPQGRDIIRLAADHFGMDQTRIMADRRDAKTVYARHVAMFVIHELTFKSTPQIGGLFNGRDHTTVLHAIKKIKRWQEEGVEQVIADVKAIRKAVASEMAGIEAPPKVEPVRPTDKFSERENIIRSMQVGDCLFFSAEPSRLVVQQAFLQVAKRLGVRIATRATERAGEEQIAVIRVG
jgi:hypothetical protein